jgi:hypothetical protein
MGNDERASEICVKPGVNQATSVVQVVGLAWLMRLTNPKHHLYSFQREPCQREVSSQRDS